jgi:hypothetical protein
MLVALACTGCMGGDDRAAEITKADLRRLVLQPADLPRVFRQFDAGELGSSDIRPGPREDPLRFGRQTGWKARYSRSGSPETRGPLVIESRVDLFGDEEGADDDLEAYRSELEATVKQIGPTERQLPDAEIGEEAVLFSAIQGSGQRAVRFYALAWREANVTASLVVNGFDGRVFVEDVLRLARKQQKRIAAASR